jgi:hypothetical protein
LEVMISCCAALLSGSGGTGLGWCGDAGGGCAFPAGHGGGGGGGGEFSAVAPSSMLPIRRCSSPTTGSARAAFPLLLWPAMAAKREEREVVARSCWWCGPQ